MLACWRRSVYAGWRNEEWTSESDVLQFVGVDTSVRYNLVIFVQRQARSEGAH